MIPFKKYSDIASKLSKKLKISKEKALQALVKAQQKGIDPLKWQQNLTMLTGIVAEFDPTIDERMMTSPQKLAQMQHYWDCLLYTSPSPRD